MVYIIKPKIRFSLLALKLNLLVNIYLSLPTDDRPFTLDIAVVYNYEPPSVGVLKTEHFSTHSGVESSAEGPFPI